MTVQRPRCNRVTPWGTLERTSHRGHMAGNRGDLHGPDGEIVRTWKRQAWISCVIATNDGHRFTFDTSGRYTPLFAFDEAVFLAAGHRPCATCRPDALARFKAAWVRCYGLPANHFIAVKQIDAELHRSRLTRDGRQKTYQARFGDLPDGVFLTLPGAPQAAFLRRGGVMATWSFEGYGAPLEVAEDLMVEVLTPAPIVEVLRAGYLPEALINAERLHRRAAPVAQVEAMTTRRYEADRSGSTLINSKHVSSRRLIQVT